MSRFVRAPPPPMNAGPVRPFSRDEAFSRTVGWLTSDELRTLRGKRVAIAGLGGVGGSHLLTLTRLGIGAFTIADFDRFELANFNRQAGASLSSLGEPKTAVLARLARDINPELDIRVFPDGVRPGDVEGFLDDADLYIDGLDFFAFAAREAVFAACARRSIPATTVGPLGMGAALLNFMPGGMTFEQYFRWAGCDDHERAIRFLVGLSPAMLQMRYLVDRSAVDLASGRGPSTPMACELCAGIAGTEAVKILLGRGNVVAAPRGIHYDAYRHRLARTHRRGGNAHPVQRALIALAKRRLQEKR
jgi:molybdopterin/thiamine biosynthesis adenylyltransferase